MVTPQLIQQGIRMEKMEKWVGQYFHFGFTVTFSCSTILADPFQQTKTILGLKNINFNASKKVIRRKQIIKRLFLFHRYFLKTTFKQAVKTRDLEV
jgi:hypothetical protein